MPTRQLTDQQISEGLAAIGREIRPAPSHPAPVDRAPTKDPDMIVPDMTVQIDGDLWIRAAQANAMESAREWIEEAMRRRFIEDESHLSQTGRALDEARSGLR